MSDFNSSLPVRTQNNGDVVVFLSDATTPTQQAAVDVHGSLATLIRDASGNAVTTQANGSQRALDIGINVAGVQIDPRLAGQYNSALPTLTSGQFTAPQTDINGRLIVVPGQDIAPATQNITAQDTVSTTTASGNQNFITGTPTTGSFALFNLTSNETVMVETTGTWTGTLQVEISVDGGTIWMAHAIHLIGTANFVSNFTTNAIGSLNVAAKTQIRVRAISTWTGTATIKIIESQNASSVYVANAIKLVDGSSTTSTTTATIKPASTAASATDTSIVVAFSPNSPLPAGSATIGIVNQGTHGSASSAWYVQDSADGPVAPGTAALFSMLIGGQYNSAGVTLTTGQQSAIQLDSSGRVIISPLTTASVIKVDLQDGAGTALTSTTVNSKQRLDVDLASDGVNGSAVPYGTTQVGGSDGTNLHALKTNTAGELMVSVQDSSGNPISTTNPLPVVVSQNIPGTSVNKYNTTVNVAASASTNHNYGITASKTFTGKKFWASASGKIRLDVQTSPDGLTFTTFWTGFNSTSDPNVSVDLDLLSITDTGTGSTIRLVITNRDLASFDVFSTISGVEN